MSRATSLVAREHELDRALHSLRFSGGVLITGEAGAGKTSWRPGSRTSCPSPPVAWLMATTASRATPLGALTGLLPPDLATIHPALVAQHVSTRLRELSRPRPVRPPVRRPRATRPAAARPGVRPPGPGGRRRPAPGPAVGRGAAVPGQRQVRTPARHDARRRDPVRRGDRALEGARGRPARPRPAGPTASRTLLESLLGGPVASGTAEMLWQSSNGNPFYLTELARFGAEHGCWRPRPGCGGGPAARRCRPGSASCCNGGSTR